MKNIRIIIILTITYSFIQNGHTQRNRCGTGKFSCGNSQCIANELLCDGRADCKNGADETVTECRKPEITCSEYAFRCAYGACVDGDAVCNGKKDCADNSDETLSRCSNGTQSASTTCAEYEFKCSNGQCIPDSDVCDGERNCADGSDETFIQCGSTRCSQFSYTCDYGACVDGDSKCNGKKDCADGSDEKRCNDTTVEPPTRQPTIRPPVTGKPPINNKCVIPPQPENGRWRFDNGVPYSTELNPGAYLLYSCNSGFKLIGSETVACSASGTWLKIPECIAIRCPSLLSTSRTADCFKSGGVASCEFPVPGTRAKLECRPSYREDAFLKYKEVRCNETGHWEPDPIRCIPACGLPPTQATLKPLIVNGTQANITQFPWHATLYRKNGDTKDFICGATIIREHLLITAAHCVYDEGTKRVYSPSLFYIATGNIYRDYDTPLHDTRIVKKSRVKNIYNVCTYFGFQGNYAGDIAILEIEKSFTFTFVLLPICLDFSSNFVEQLIPGSYGKVAGFGRTGPDGPSSFILQSLSVPYVPFNQCKSLSATVQAQHLITEDKFCAGYTNGSSVCDGDSGGGLVFQNSLDGLWYLQGIVSTSLGIIDIGGTAMCNSKSYALYTRVSSHISWIQSILINIDSHKSIPPCNQRNIFD